MHSDLYIRQKKRGCGHLNITFLGRFLYRITTRSTKSLYFHKNLNRKKIEMSTSLRFNPSLRKTAYTKKIISLTFNIKQNLLFWKIQIS